MPRKAGPVKRCDLLLQSCRQMLPVTTWSCPVTQRNPTTEDMGDDAKAFAERVGLKVVMFALRSIVLGKVVEEAAHAVRTGSGSQTRSPRQDATSTLHHLESPVTAYYGGRGRRSVHHLVDITTSDEGGS
jgi:hypothetical protein